MSAKGRKSVESNFNMATLTGKITSVYEDVVSRNQSISHTG